MIVKSVSYTYSCDEPGCKAVLVCANQFYPKQQGWGVSRDRKTCWCSVHLRRHKNVGCYGLASWR